MEYSKTMHQSQKQEMQQNTMYLAHKGEIQQNIASIAQGRNATKIQCFYRWRVKYSETMHQSHKDEMQQNKMYLPHEGEIQQNVASIAQGRNTTKIECIYHTRV